MARYLYMEDGVVINVVEYPEVPPLKKIEIVLDPTGTTNIGDSPKIVVPSADTDILVELLILKNVITQPELDDINRKKK